MNPSITITYLFSNVYTTTLSCFFCVALFFALDLLPYFYPKSLNSVCLRYSYYISPVFNGLLFVRPAEYLKACGNFFSILWLFFWWFSSLIMCLYAGQEYPILEIGLYVCLQYCLFSHTKSSFIQQPRYGEGTFSYFGKWLFLKPYKQLQGIGPCHYSLNHIFNYFLDFIRVNNPLSMISLTNFEELLSIEISKC